MEKRPNQDYTQYYYNLEEIGRGKLSIVYKGREIKTNELRAIKVIQLNKLKESIISNGNEDTEKKLKECIDGYINECESMKICSNINSVKFYEYFNDENNFVIIMELCDSNLLQLLLKKNKEGFNLREIYEILKQLNNSLKIMKQNSIIHKNLKLENILIKNEDNNKYLIKLSGYASSKRLNSLTKNNFNSNEGTLIYIAPEILKGESYNYKCDLWSIGVIIYKLKFVKSIFNGQTEDELIQNINNFTNEIIEKTGNVDLDDLIKKLLEKDYIKRLNWDEYFNHPFFHPFSKEINVIYYKKSEKDTLNRDNNIFGKKFVENNKNNVELKLNGMKIEFAQKYELEYGENKIEIIIKNKIINFEHMFYDCISLKNIEGLKYLDVSSGNNFSSMFFGCKSLSDIKPLENWDVSNGNNFSSMFFRCNSLSDIKPLENWNVSNGSNFSLMFFGCNLSDKKPLEKWNISNGNISNLFKKNESLPNIKELEKKVSETNIDKDNYKNINDTNGDKIDNKIKSPDIDNNNINKINDINISNNNNDNSKIDNNYNNNNNNNIIINNDIKNNNSENNINNNNNSTNNNNSINNNNIINNNININNNNTNNNNNKINNNININIINNYIDNINNQQKPEYIFPIKGLDNIGSTCYMNSTLQCLLHVSELVNYFLYEYKNDKDTLKNKNKNSPTLGKISEVFYELVLGVNSKNNKENTTSKKFGFMNLFKSKEEENSFSPKNFKNILGTCNSQFKDFSANDSKDLLLYLLQTMHEELNYFGDNPPINLPQPNQEDRASTFMYFMNFYNNQNFSIISKYFYGTYEIITTCHFCYTTIYNFQKFEFISFGMFKYNKKTFDIIDGFKDNEESQELKGDNKFYCNKCQLLSEASSTCKIIQPPNKLIINIDYGINKKYNPSNIKFDDIIDITKYVNFNFGTPIKYEITGVCTHLRPSGFFGHYVTFCKNKDNGKWYSFNDSSCNEIQYKDEIYKGSPYILLYEKI